MNDVNLSADIIPNLISAANENYQLACEYSDQALPLIKSAMAAAIITADSLTQIKGHLSFDDQFDDEAWGAWLADNFEGNAHRVRRWMIELPHWQRINGPLEMLNQFQDLIVVADEDEPEAPRKPVESKVVGDNGDGGNQVGNAPPARTAATVAAPASPVADDAAKAGFKSARKVIEDARNAMKALKGAITRLGNLETGMEHIDVYGYAPLIEAVDAADMQLRLYGPMMLCPAPHAGAKCRYCYGLGWINKTQFDNLPPEMKGAK